MSQCCVPNCNLKQQQRQEQVEEEDNLKSSSHVHNPLIMSNYEVAELTWENGQLAMHGLGGLPPTAQTKPTWSSRAHDTLESVVQQATYQHQKSNLIMPPPHHTPTTRSSAAVASGGMTLAEKSGKAQMAVPMLTRKRTLSDSGYCGGNFSSKTKVLEECDPSSGCASASASAMFCRDNESTMMSLASYETGRSLKSNKILDHDSPSLCGSENQEQEEDRDTKVEISGSTPTRRNRAAAIHNQSERKRRDRINQKMKALQRLVPNASKTDKASMLDEVIEYLKQLQAQIQIMSTRNIPHQQQMMMMMMMPPPLAMQQQQQQQQQQLQMSMLARMGVGLGLGLGMGLPNMNNTSMAVASTGGPPSLPQLAVGAPAIAPTFVVPSLIQAHAHAPLKPEPAASVASTNASVSLPGPYTTVLSQSVNMDIIDSMAALYRQQIKQKNQALSSLSQQYHGQGV